MSSDKETSEPRYYGMELGTVADDADPEGLGRVRVIVPGIIDQPSPWAPPLGTLGGGGPQRGFFTVPPKGSDVAVFFHRGDPERPYYLSGHWGKPAAGDEVPEDVKAAPAAERHKISEFDTRVWKIVYDDRENKEAIRIMHKTLALRIELDAAKGVIDLEAETALNIKSNGTVNVDAPQVQLAGRTVIPNGKPIN